MSSYTNIALLHQQTSFSKELFSYFQVAHVNEFWSSNHLLNYLTAETQFSARYALCCQSLYVHGEHANSIRTFPALSDTIGGDRIQKGKTGCQPQICGLTGVYLILQRLGLQIQAKDEHRLLDKKSQLSPKTNKLFLAKEMLFNVEQFETQAGANNQKVIDFLLAKYMTQQSI